MSVNCASGVVRSGSTSALAEKAVSRRDRGREALRSELEARLERVEQELSRLPQGSDPDALLERRLALTIALAELHAADPATSPDELEKTARDRMAPEPARPVTIAGSLGKNEVDFDVGLELAGKPEDDRASDGLARSARHGKSEGQENGKGRAASCGAGSCATDDEELRSGDGEGKEAAEGHGAQRHEARVRQLAPPLGLLRALRRHARPLALCLPSDLRDAVQLQVEARLDASGLLRAPRVKVHGSDDLSEAPSLPLAVLECVADVLRAVRVDDPDGQSRVVAFVLRGRGER
jgi:hypothetical protein